MDELRGYGDRGYGDRGYGDRGYGDRCNNPETPPQLPQTKTCNPCFCTTASSLHAIPLGRFAPVSQFSTVHRFVEAARGTLELQVELPGMRPFTLTGVGEIG